MRDGLHDPNYSSGDILKKFITLYILSFLFSIGCSDDAEHVAAPGEPTFDQRVYANCLAVQTAAEAYADANGEYPYFTCDQLDNFLPDSTALTNPLSGQRTEPVMFEPSGFGSVSYRIFAEYDRNANWQVVGYYIVGRGLYEDFVVTNTADPQIHLDREQTIIDNILTLTDAIDEFISNNQGQYPVDASEQNYMGWTLLDYLPDRQLLLNPYTNQRTEPSQWTQQRPDSPGQIAYSYYDADGDGLRDGCRIQAVGSYAPYRISDFDKGHWMDDGYIGYAPQGWCPRGDQLQISSN